MTHPVNEIPDAVDLEGTNIGLYEGHDSIMGRHGGLSEYQSHRAS
jgi:hypothetical protein